MKAIRVLIIDDHKIFTNALRLLLSNEEGIEIVGAGYSAREAVEMSQVLRPDVILLDIDLPDRGGIDALREIRRENADARAVIITAYQGEDVAVEAIQAGAHGYVHKARAPEELVRAIHQAAAGGMALSSAQLSGVFSRLASSREEHSVERRLLAQLTPRETEVLSAIASGMSTQEAASYLGVTRMTLQNHVKNILAKLQVRSRLEAVTLAMSAGIVAGRAARRA